MTKRKKLTIIARVNNIDLTTVGLDKFSNLLTSYLKLVKLKYPITIILKTTLNTRDTVEMKERKVLGPVPVAECEYCLFMLTFSY